MRTAISNCHGSPHVRERMQLSFPVRNTTVGYRRRTILVRVGRRVGRIQRTRLALSSPFGYMSLARVLRREAV